MVIPMPYDQLGYRYLQRVPGNKIHSGVDLNFGVNEEDLGMPVVSMADGEVIVSELDQSSGWGNLVVIYHPVQRVWSRYAHLLRRDVRVGDNVREGQQIGLCGNTGASSAPHLHWDVIIKQIATWKSYTTGWTISRTQEYYADPIAFVNQNRVNPNPTEPPDNPNIMPQWQRDARDWAVSNGVSNGERPNDPLTRVELWETLRKYHQRAESIPSRIPR